jgi:5-formyltetrahydrofolate cyclo-ligase
MVTNLKNAVRKPILEKRNALTAAQIAELSSQIADRLFEQPEFKKARVVAFYLAKGSEVDTRQMIEHALAEGKEVLVPVTNHKIEFFRFESFDDLVKGKFGILEPKNRTKPTTNNLPKTDSETIINPDVVIVPGVSFGLCMHRLGYGKGYYDIYLASFGLGSHRPFAIGVCYDFQLVESLPKHENDQKMDCIVTEKRIIR